MHEKHSTNIRSHYVRLMLSTTLILYCKREALQHAPDIYTANRPLGAPSNSTLASRSYAFSRKFAEKAARLFHSQGRLSMPLYDSRVPDRFSKVAHALDPGKRSGSTGYLSTASRCAWPHPFVCARGGFQATRKQPVYAPGHLRRRRYDRTGVSCEPRIIHARYVRAHACSYASPS